MILSFAWTTAAVVLDQKCETRRDWMWRHVERVQRAIDDGQTFEAWTAGPHRKGRPFGRVRLTSLRRQEASCDVPDGSWEREGFHVLEALKVPFAGNHTAAHVWRYWKQRPPGENRQTVVAFKLEDLNALGESLMADYRERLDLAGGPVSLTEAMR